MRRRENTLRIYSDYTIGTMINRCRSLGILTQSEAGNTQRGSFLLHSARVCKHDARPVVKREKIEIAQRIEGHDSNSAARFLRQILP